MRIPLSWLGEYVTLSKNTTPEAVHEALVSVGLEEEAIHRFDVEGPVVVGEILEFQDEPQSNGKTIRWCQVKVASKDSQGAPAIRGIVCGAHNFEVGDKVVVALPGAVLPGPFPITARTTYGHVSDGMIASAKELGLGDDHSGILRLSELGLDPEVGTDAVAMLGLHDVACEVNVTPDRGYALSIRGIAREYHHATGAEFRDPADALTPDVGSGFEVSLSDQSPMRGVPGCRVFITRAVMGIDLSKPTPAFMVARLALAGMRSISLPVDITNYVMLELGQPIHAYDLDRLTGGITVRRASKGEKLTTLDGVERTLHHEDLLITDASGPIGMAGVMGGASTEITDGTTNVLVEAAWFDPVSIARTSRRHKLPSEASKRFARGVDPLVAEAAAERVVSLLETYAGGARSSLGSRVLDAAAGVMPGIVMRAGAVESLTGIQVSPEDTLRILGDIGATVSQQGDSLVVTPPSWRPDLVDEPGLVEEVARIIGYDRIPSVLPVAPAGRGLSFAQSTRRLINTSLSAWGMTEVLSYPFVSHSDNVLFGVNDLDVTVANALDSDANRMRVSLLPGLLDVAHRNVSRGFTSLALYETGLVFVASTGKPGTEGIPVGNERPRDKDLAGLYRSIPHQPWHVAGLFVGPVRKSTPARKAESADILDALEAATVAARAVQVELEVRNATHPAFHPGRYAELTVGGVIVGFVGELLPRLVRARDLMGRVAAFSLDVDVMVSSRGSEPRAARALSTYPAATQDVSLVVSADVSAIELQNALVHGAGELLEAIECVDEYRGEGIAPGFRSLTFALRFRAPDRTLTQAEATEAKERGVARASELFGAQIRA